MSKFDDENNNNLGEEISEDLVLESDPASDDQESGDSGLDEAADEEIEAGEDGEASEEEQVELVLGEKNEVDDDVAETPVIKTLRQRDREHTKRIKQMERELEQLRQAQQAAAPQVSDAEPQLSDPDIDYDPDLYKQRLIAWHARQSEKQAQQQQVQKAWQDKVISHKEKAKALKVQDFEVAEEFASTVFNQGQLAAIIDLADDSAKMMYVLSKNPSRAKELAETANIGMFIKKMSLLETEMKTAKKKPSASPEKTVSGGASGGVRGRDARLEQLEREAEKTGDRTKIVAYKRQLRDKANK